MTYDQRVSARLRRKLANEQAPRGLLLVPMTLAEARVWIEETHRHHGAPQGAMFAVGVQHDGRIVGVATVGRPVARHLDDGWSAEVTRLASDGTKNVCSMLYAACWRAARAIGYRRLITYVLSTEPGTSLKAAGWRCIGSTGEKRGWTRPKRARIDTHPLQEKIRWEMSEGT